jgi:hypothetical protein
MFSNKADKKELFKITSSPLLVMVKAQITKGRLHLQLVLQFVNVKKRKECDVYMLTLLTDKEWFVCERLLYEVIK